MKYFSSTVAVCLLCVLLLCSGKVLNAQHISNYDNNGKIKPVSEFNKKPADQPVIKPSTPPTTTTTTTTNRNSGATNTDKPVVEPGGYDFYGAADDNNLKPVRLGDKWGYIYWDPIFSNNRSKVIIPVIYTELKFAGNGFYGVKEYGKWGFVNKTGEVAVPLIYDELLSALAPSTFFINKYTAKVSMNGVAREIDSKGNVTRW